MGLVQNSIRDISLLVTSISSVIVREHIILDNRMVIRYV